MTVDTIFLNASVYNTYLGMWVSADIAVLKGKILAVGKSDSLGLNGLETIECNGRPVIPGMIDIHLHIESSLCTPDTFSTAVLPRGVTTVVAEHHEMANIFGRKGIEEMIHASRQTALDIFCGIPSSVPSTSATLETTGGAIDASDLPYLIDGNPDVICLGEVMNYPTLLNEFEAIAKDPESLVTTRLISYLHTRHPLMAIEGHCPSIKSLDLAKLLYLGIDSDHCQQDVDGMEQRFANGMFVEIQEKSLTQEIVDYLEHHHVEGLWSFVTDDVPPDVLVRDGHLDHVVRKALSMGLSLEKAIIATSSAPAMRMGLRDRGVIAPGKIADLIILADDSSAFTIDAVYKNGEAVQRSLEHQRPYRYQDFITDSIALDPKKDFSPIFDISIAHAATHQDVRVMVKRPHTTYTEAIIQRLAVADSLLCWEQAQKPINLVVVINRYSEQLSFGQGLCSGDCLNGGAYAATYAHDHHNILVIGDNRRDMLLALTWVLERRGGICVTSQGRVEAAIQLPIGGILSDQPMEALGRSVSSIQQTLYSLGMEHPNPLMSLSTITLPVSPALKITDKGLVDVNAGTRVPLLVKEQYS